jgi:hypothetical protein
LMKILTFCLLWFCQTLLLLPQRCWPITLYEALSPLCTCNTTWDGHHCLLKFWWSFCVSTFGRCSKKWLAHRPCICILFDILVLC